MEITLIFSALSLGFASGFHCIGMCGPIALSLGISRKNAIKFYAQNITYQLGRVFTYAILGAVLGIVGQGFQMSGFQNILTISVGVLLIIMAIFSFGGTDFASKIPLLSKMLLQVKLKLGKLLQKTDYQSRFLTGFLNGFLPCGMVYMALTSSLAAGGIWQSAAFMLLFGLGTIPFMFFTVIAGQLISITLRTKILKLIPLFMIILGGLFILRGLGLGIPYLSPSQSSMQIHDPSHMENMEHCH